MEEALYTLGSVAAIGAFCALFVQSLLRRRRQSPALDEAERDRLTTRLGQVEAELWALREEQTAVLEDVHERLDFAERLLTQGGPDRHSPAREVTPV